MAWLLWAPYTVGMKIGTDALLVDVAKLLYTWLRRGKRGAIKIRQNATRHTIFSPAKEANCCLRFFSCPLWMEAHFFRCAVSHLHTTRNRLFFSPSWRCVTRVSSFEVLFIVRSNRFVATATPLHVSPNCSVSYHHVSSLLTLNLMTYSECKQRSVGGDIVADLGAEEDDEIRITLQNSCQVLQ